MACIFDTKPSPNRVKHRARFRYRCLIKFCSMLARFWLRFREPKLAQWGSFLGRFLEVRKRVQKWSLAWPGVGGRDLRNGACGSLKQVPVPVPVSVTVSSTRFQSPFSGTRTGNRKLELKTRVSCYLLLVACYLELVLTCCLLVGGPGHAKRAGGTVADY